jgi:hypothetical protein
MKKPPPTKNLPVVEPMVGRRAGFIGSAMLMTTTFCVSPTESRTQMYLSLCIVSVAMLAELMPTFASWKPQR